MLDSQFNYDFKLSKNGAPFIKIEKIEEITERILKKYCPQVINEPQPLDIDVLVELDLGFNVEYAYLSHNQCYAGMMVFNDSDVIISLKDLTSNPKTGKFELEYLTERGNTILIDRTIDNESDRAFRRFTLGHEAGHGVLHHNVFYKNSDQISFFDNDANIDDHQSTYIACRTTDLKKTGNGWGMLETLEWQANTFSSCLLMNEKAVNKLVKQMGYYNKMLTYQESYNLAMKVSEVFDVSKSAALVRLKVLGYINNNYSLADLIILDDFIF